MKKILVAVAALVFILAIVTAVADEMPIMTESRDAGTMLGIDAPGHVSKHTGFRGGLLLTPEDVLPAGRKDFSGPPVSDKLVDVGTALYLSEFGPKTEMGITGMAAGGVAREERTTRIWDDLMAPTVGWE